MAFSKAVLLGACASLAGGSSAMAGFDAAVVDGGHAAVLTTIYGGAWLGSAASGTWTNGAITLSRVDDFGLGGVLNINGSPGFTDDQLWSDGLADVSAEVKIAGFKQSFGFYGGHAGALGSGTFTEIVTDASLGGPAVSATLPSTFRWGRRGTSATFDANYHSSLDSDNADGLNHMISYEVVGFSAQKTWLLWWEDLNAPPAGGGRDNDYRDFVVQVMVIPLPSAAGLGIVGLLGVAGLRRRRG